MAKRVVPHETRFKRNTKALVAVFNAYFEGLDEDERPDMTNFNLGYQLLRGMDQDDLVIKFIANTSEHWEKLQNKDNKFLLGSALDLMGERYRKKMNPYVKAITGENKQLLLSVKATSEAWEYVHNMVKCSIRFLHESKTKITDKKLSLLGITNREQLNLDTTALSQVWKIDLKAKFEESDDEGSDDSSVSSATDS